MKKRNLPIIASTALSTLLTGCGGGGSSSTAVNSDSTSHNGDSDTNAIQIPKVAVTEHPEINLSEQRAENVIASVHGALRKQMSDMRSVMDDVDLDKGASVQTTFEGGQTSAQSLDCERGGTWEVEFTNGPQSYTDPQGYNVSAAGATAKQTFLNCGSEYYNYPNVLWGSTKTEVVRGLFDNFSILSSGTLLRDTAEHFIVVSQRISDTDKTGFGKYVHGVTETEYTSAGTLSFRGDFLAEKDPQSYYFQGDLQLHSFDFSMKKLPGSYSWDSTYELREKEGFKLDLVKEDQRLNVEITSKLIFSDAFSKITDGKVQIASAQGILTFQYFKDYIDYKLDADEDGDFEVTGIINKSSL